MPIQTLVCPDCARATTIDIPTGFKATVVHREHPGTRSVDLIRVRPRIQPMSRPTRPEQPNQELRQTLGRGG